MVQAAVPDGPVPGTTDDGGLAVSAFQVTDMPSPRVRAIEARQVATKLRPSIERAGLSGPDLRVTGPAFAGAFDAWVDQLAGRLEAGR